MPYRRWLVGLFGLLTLTATARPADPSPPPAPFSPAAPAPFFGIPDVHLQSLPADIRAGIQAVIDRPTLSAKGPSETFNADTGTYRWLLEHPDAGTKMWRLLGARVMDIVAR